jgi:alpha-galactosidase
MALKIALIGADSIGFTRTLLHDIVAVPELANTMFAFTDISSRNLELVTQLCTRDLEANKLPAKIVATTDRRKAIADSDYVICTIRQGGLEAFQTDIEIPLTYGVDQCVGDTICAGGIMYAQRTIPALLNVCKDIRKVAMSTLAELCEPSGHEHVGVQQVRKGQNDRSVSRGAGVTLADYQVH